MPDGKQLADITIAFDLVLHHDGGVKMVVRAGGPVILEVPLSRNSVSVVEAAITAQTRNLYKEIMCKLTLKARRHKRSGRHEDTKSHNRGFEKPGSIANARRLHCGGSPHRG